MRYYNVELILYDEKEIERIINKINNEMEWASAYHDKDKEENGKIKKAHTHLQIYGNLQKSIKAWSKYLEVKEEQIEKIKDKKQAILYLTHRDRKEKTQYPIEIIKSNFDIKPYYEEKITETQEIKLIIDYIEKHSLIKYKDLLYYTLENNLWSTYRRNYSIIKDYINEKNILTKNNLF